ncbi:Cyclin-G2 [Lamellibrachia satsuma]|nr:Cyclin-G2 [Lamellibrachia satsuma]
MGKKTMGLEGIEGAQKIANFGDIKPLSTTMLYIESLPMVGNCNNSCCISNSIMQQSSGLTENCNQLQLLLQAQALMKKNSLYQKIDESLRRSPRFRPNIYNIPQTADDDNTVTGLHRDNAVHNLRFLNVFYGCSPATFALTSNLLDRLLGKVRAHPRYLSCIAASCFYIAAKVQEENGIIPSAADLVKLSQCGGTPDDLRRMERLILDKLHWELNSVTPLTFLRYFYEVFADKDPRVADPLVFSSLIARLEVLMCQFQFTKYRAETLALTLISCVIQELDPSKQLSMDQFSAIVELQYYCQISDTEFLQCRCLVLDYLAVYSSQPSRPPRLQLVWTVSRRTLNKLKPSTRVLLDLEPIVEDEVDENDAGLFDSENDENEMQRRIRMSLHGGLQHPLEAKCVDMSFLLLHSSDDDDNNNKVDQEHL